MGRHFLPGPVLRVDVMQRVDAQGNKFYVVNEFESLEALIAAQGRHGAVIDARVHTYLVEYWAQMIAKDLV